MARTGTDENKQANAINQQEKQQAYSTGQKAVGQATSNISKLTTTGSVGVNPWISPDYLANENRLQADALNASNNAAKSEIRRQDLATGGLNGSVGNLTIRDLALQKARLADQLSAERAASDYDKNVGYQQSLAMMPLSVAGAESPYFGTATEGQGQALGNLTQLGIASYGPWMSGISALGQAASKAIPTKGCWIAEALYGEKDWRTLLLRSWLNTEFKTRWYGRAVMNLYLKFGERIAAQIRRRRWIGEFFRPFFEVALWKAVEERNLDIRRLQLEGF